MSDVRITHVGGPTTLIEAAGLRIVVDPTFDAPGRRYSFGWGTSSRKLAGPAFPAADLPAIDVVLLTHDHHADNLDDAGRALLPSARTVVTTTPGARRLGGSTIGLAPWHTTTIGYGGITVTATPARHGPPLSRPVAGAVIGFALDLPGGVLWISGDTVLYDGLRQVADRLRVDIALLHLGGVQFGLTGPLRYTMVGRDAVELSRLLSPRAIVPVHYEGWSHFHEGRAGVERAFATEPDLARRVVWLEPGVAREI